MLLMLWTVFRLWITGRGQELQEPTLPQEPTLLQDLPLPQELSLWLYAGSSLHLYPLPAAGDCAECRPEDVAEDIKAILYAGILSGYDLVDLHAQTLLMAVDAGLGEDGYQRLLAAAWSMALSHLLLAEHLCESMQARLAAAANLLKLRRESLAWHGDGMALRHYDALTGHPCVDG